MIAQYNTAETNLFYLFPKAGEAGKKATLPVWILRAMFLISVFLGAVRSTTLVWAMADVGTGLTTWLTLLTGLLVIKPVKMVWDDYVAQKNKGIENPIFRPSKVGIKNAEIWEDIADDYESGKLKDN